MENIRNSVDIRLISSDNVAQNLAAKPNYYRCTIFDENLIAVHMKKTKLYFHKPVYLDMSILDLSKSLIYDFHYNCIKTYYGDNAKLLFADTDSLSHMKSRPKNFTKISTPTLRNGLTLVTTRLIIHLDLRQDLIAKCLECLRMKLVGSRLLNLLVCELNYTLTICLMALKIKNVRGCKKMLQKGVSIESACLAGRNNIEKWMSYEVIVKTFIPKKLIKLPSLLTMTNDLLWPTEYTL